jgi:hypothetical protein
MPTTEATPRRGLSHRGGRSAGRTHPPRHRLADAPAKQALEGAELACSDDDEIDVMFLG